MTEEYNASSIKALTPREHLLKRMSLTFGPIESEGELHSKQKGVALRELQDNAVDEAIAGYASWFKSSFFSDRSFQIEDNGRGIPVDIGVDAYGKKASGIYLALGVIQSGGKFSTDSKRFSTGLNGVGSSSTIAVSKRADITVYRNKKIYSLSFKDGEPGFFSAPNDPNSSFTPLKDFTKLEERADNRSPAEKKKAPTGTTVRVWLDDRVFSSQNPYDEQDIIDRARGAAFLLPKVTVEVYNELKEIDEKPQTEKYHFENGLEDLIDLSQPDEKLINTIHIETEGCYLEKNVPVIQPDGKILNKDIERHVPISVAMRYGDKYEPTVSTYVNTIYTKLNGVHLTAFERALTATFNEKFESMRGLIKKGEESPVSDDFLEGLTAVVSIQVSEPVFTSQSKEALSGREVQKAVQEALIESFSKWIADKKNASALELIAKKVVTASQNRQRAKEQKELNRKKNEISAGSLPVKLIDCEKSGEDVSELYICEGDSAVTSLKAARDGNFQALLPIRGKIINAYNTTPAKLLANKEVQDIIKTLGAGSGKDFDLDNMRYGKVFIATDADADGYGIGCLIYALFWILFKPVIEANRLFKIETPLFVFSTKEGAKSRKIYAKDALEKDKITAELEKKKTKYSVARMKGLGEMNADVLEETGLHADTRIVTQVTTNDVASAAISLELIFGDDTDRRKQWIIDADVDEDLLGE